MQKVLVSVRQPQAAQGGLPWTSGLSLPSATFRASEPPCQLSLHLQRCSRPRKEHSGSQSPLLCTRNSHHGQILCTQKMQSFEFHFKFRMASRSQLPRGTCIDSRDGTQEGWRTGDMTQDARGPVSTGDAAAEQVSVVRAAQECSPWAPGDQLWAAA